MGLLTPGTRTAGNFRVYGHEAIGRVRWIAQLQDLGFTLNDIQDTVQATAAGDVPKEAMTRVRQLFSDKLDELSAQIRRLEQLRSELGHALSWLDECGGCGTVGVAPTACQGCHQHHEPDAPELVKGLTDTAIDNLKSPGDES